MERNHKRLYAKLRMYKGFEVKLVDNNTVVVYEESQEEPFIEVTGGMLTLKTWLCKTDDYTQHSHDVERIIGICEGFIM